MYLLKYYIGANYIYKFKLLTNLTPLKSVLKSLFAITAALRCLYTSFSPTLLIKSSAIYIVFVTKPYRRYYGRLVNRLGM